MLVAPTFTEIMEVAKSGGKLSEAPNLFPDFGWPLQDGSGDEARDVGGQGLTGVLTNGPTWVDATRGGKALDFVAASSQWVNIGNTNCAPSGFAVSLWVRLDSIGAAASEILHLQSAFDNSLWIYADGDIAFGDGSFSSSTWDRWDINLTWIGMWRHIVVTGSTGTPTPGVTVYIDGVSYGAKSDLYVRVPFNAVSLANGTSFSYMDGQLADFRIFPWALTDSEVEQLYVKGWASYRLRSHVLAAVVVGAGVPKHFLHYAKMRAA